MTWDEKYKHFSVKKKNEKTMYKMNSYKTRIKAALLRYACLRKQFGKLNELKRGRRGKLNKYNIKFYFTVTFH